MNENEKISLQERGFAKSIGFGKRPALLIVDFVNAFTDPSAPLGGKADRQIIITNSIISFARKNDVPVLFSTIRYDGHELEDAGIWINKIGGLTTLASNLKGSEVDYRLDRRPEDAVIVKKFASCFFGTDLTSRLIAKQIDTLIITGCTTSGCVRATAVDACQSGFRPVVVSDAVMDRVEASHHQSLIDISLKYGDVLTSLETMAKIENRHQ
ncbi:isochorismatase family protein [Pantoea sp. At-9b]|uniref:isochorismatase family protein n=1 Tax=Pantoea sp. (strain At-9b) TaxID=592316 RepID=UPI0001B40AF5|nr:isochorismatase family protein [Pantoea sp. At-9b]ADU72081.1 isochorismatase hydrolase [Pantoea sp. At-9b]